MKNRYYLLLLLCALLTECIHRHKITYNIPESIPEPQRSELVDKIKKGKELYKEHCSECHGVFTKGVENVPNFTNQQFDNYSMKFMRRDPKNHAVMAKMSMEQMNEVIDFLRYKRPQNPDSAVNSRAIRK